MFQDPENPHPPSSGMGDNVLGGFESARAEWQGTPPGQLPSYRGVTKLELERIAPSSPGSNPEGEGALETSPLRGIGLFGLDLSNLSLNPLPPERKELGRGER